MIFRFGTCPTGIRVISFRVAMSIAETEFDPADAVVTCTVNGELRQMGSTRDMIFPVRQLVAFVSSVMTLEPGDLLLTGTPAGVGALKDGDEVVASIEGLGDLRNPVRLETPH